VYVGLFFAEMLRDPALSFYVYDTWAGACTVPYKMSQPLYRLGLGRAVRVKDEQLGLRTSVSCVICVCVCASASCLCTPHVFLVPGPVFRCQCMRTLEAWCTETRNPKPETGVARRPTPSNVHVEATCGGYMPTPNP
jgi:hypothetical protein